MGAPGGATLIGAEVLVTAGEIHTDDDRTYALIGQSMTISDGLAVTSYLAFATGQVLTVGQQEIGPRGVTLTGASVAVSAGVVSPPVTDPGTGGGGGGKPPKPPKPPKPKKHRDEDPLVHRPGQVVPTTRDEQIEKIAENLERKKKKPDDDEDEALLLL